jgi:hypothetical protein
MSEEKRHPVFESNDMERRRAFIKLDSLTPVVRAFLAKTEPFASDRVELRSAKVVDNNRMLRYILIGGTECDQRHYKAVHTNLPGFTIRTVFEPQSHGSLGAMGSVTSGHMVLEFPVSKSRGLFSGFSGKLVNAGIIVVFAVLLYLMQMYLGHTRNDSDRFGVVWRLVGS